MRKILCNSLLLLFKMISIFPRGSAVPWGPTRVDDDSGRARERPQRKRSSAFEGARPRRLPHDAAVTVAHGVRSTGTETLNPL